MVRPLGIVLAFGLLASTLHTDILADQPPADSSAGAVAKADLMQRFLAPDAKPLVSYRARRKMSAATRGGKMSASVDVWTTLDPATGFNYEIVSEEGSGLIRSRVLKEALDTEKKTVGKTDGDEAALTTANYKFLEMSMAEDLVRVQVKPHKDHVMRVQGALFIDPASADLRRVEGQLSKRPSFWTRRVQIEREYARIDGVHVPVSMKSTADVLIVGQSTFSMTYAYAEINGQPVP